MSNKNWKFILVAVISAILARPAMAEEVSIDDGMPVGDRPVFVQIAELEQEKILLQLEKDRAQLMLDLDRMAAEQARIRGELDGSGSAAAARELADERAKLEQEREAMRRQSETSAERPAPAPTPQKEEKAPAKGIAERYKLIDIVGAGRQLQATLEDTKTGQRKKVWVGKEIDGYEVRSISLDDGVVFEKDGEIEALGATGGN